MRSLSLKQKKFLDFINNFTLTQNEAPTYDEIMLGLGFKSLGTVNWYVKTLEKRQGLKISCIEELAMEQGFITSEQAYNLGKKLDKTEYGRYIMKRAKEWKS